MGNEKLKYEYCEKFRQRNPNYRNKDYSGYRVRNKGDVDNPGAFKLRDFDKQLFENLCSIQCTDKEIVGVLNTDIRTLNAWCLRTYNKHFLDVKSKFDNGGRAYIRRCQYRHCYKSPTMSMYMGKVILGQKEGLTLDEVVKTKLETLIDKLEPKKPLIDVPQQDEDLQELSTDDIDPQTNDEAIVAYEPTSDTNIAGFESEADRELSQFNGQDESLAGCGEVGEDLCVDTETPTAD